MTSEDQLSLFLARGSLPPRVQEQARALLATPLDWDLILERVTAEEIYPLFYRNLETLGFAGVGKQGAGSKEQGAGSGEQGANGELRIAKCEIAESPVVGPRSVRERLGGLAKINAFRNTLLTEELVRVLKLLADAGIPTIPLKGVTLAQSLYGDPALRACVDLDILVPRSMVARAFNLLRVPTLTLDLNGAVLQ